MRELGSIRAGRELESQVPDVIHQNQNKLNADELFEQGNKNYNKYLNNRSIQDLETAAYYYRDAAEQGSVDACYALGKMCKSNYDEDPEKYKKFLIHAIRWYKRADSRGHVQASFDLGKIYFRQKDYKEAFGYYTKAADRRNPEALFDLAACYLYGHGVQQDLGLALDKCTAAAEQGSVKAQFYLGELYEGRIRSDVQEKISVPKDIKKSIYWYQRAANQGNLDACNNLGELNRYYKNNDKAIEYWNYAANKGHIGSQVNLGISYWRNFQDNKDKDFNDFVEAANLFTKVEKKDDSGRAKFFLGRIAQYLGRILDNPAQLQKGVEWFIKSAEKGYPDAQFFLGLCFYKGEGVEKNLPRASIYLKKALKNGIAEAQVVINNIIEEEQKQSCSKAGNDEFNYDF